MSKQYGSRVGLRIKFREKCIQSLV